MKRSRQHGGGLVSFLTVIACLIALVIGMRLFPLYMEAWSVRSIVNGLASDGTVATAPYNEVTRMLETRLQINNIKRVAPQDFVIESIAGGGYYFQVDYEARTSLVGNLDAVARFSYDAQTR